MKTGPRVTDKVLVIADNVYNIGDFALLRQLVYGIRSSTDIRDISIRQWSAPSKDAVQYFAAHGCRLGRSKWQFLFSPGRIAVVGGGQFIRGNVSISSLLFMIFTLATSGRPAVALAIGGGTVKDGLRKRLWRVLLARFAVITLRDQTSLELVRDLLPPHARQDVTCDLAFLPSDLHDRHIGSDQPQTVVVAPCLSHEEDRLIDAAWVARMCAGLAAHFGVDTVAIIPHDDRPGVDRPICIDIESELSALAGSAAKRLEDCTLDAALEIYGHCAVVMTNRLHSLIFGLLAGKPVLVIDDGNPKLKVFADRFLIGLLPQGCGIDTLTAALTRETQPERLAARTAALEFARAEAARNFELMRDCLV